MVLQDIYCEKCGEQCTDILHKWCKPCQINGLEENFKIWTSKNEKIDNFIQEMQLKVNHYDDIVCEWIPYNQFIDIKEISRDNFAKVSSAIWKDGPLYYDYCRKGYTRNQNEKIILKCLYNSQNVTTKLLNKVRVN